MVRSALLYHGWVWACLLLSASCIVDDDQPCDTHQVELKGKITGCVCAPGTAPNPDGSGCSPCGDHEEPRGGACVCVAGYSRSQPLAACEAADDGGPVGEQPPTGEGSPCQTNTDCEQFDATFCQNLIEPYICLVQGCALGERTCYGESVCCRFDAFEPLADTHGVCVPQASCVAPGVVVGQ